MKPLRIEAYTKHGCNITPSQGKALYVIDYSSHVTNHKFNGAYGAGGLYEYLDKARAMVKDTPRFKEHLAIPDYVFECDEMWWGNDKT